MNFRSIANLNETITRNLHRIPRDVDLVVGIPRSGLLAANIIALHLNLPLTDVDGFLSGRVFASGARLPSPRRDFVSSAKKVLVVDDSILSGDSMARTREALDAVSKRFDFVFLAVYTSLIARSKVDIGLEEIIGPRMFEWNFMHHCDLVKCCVDIDGVLCADPHDEDNDDGTRYARFLSGARPLRLPSVPVGWLVTCRLEKYRRPTEEWLTRHGVTFGRLMMMDCSSKQERQGMHARFKADVYRRTRAVLFIESSHQQAVEIAIRARRPVLSVENCEIVYPSTVASLDSAMRRVPDVLRHRGGRVVRYMRRRFLHVDPPRSGR